MQNKRKILVWTLLLLITLGALFVRFYQLESIPGGIYPDEAVNGEDALRAIATGEYKLFYEANNGREGLFINLQALSIQWFGHTIFGLLFWSAVIGTLTVVGSFFLSRELFRSSLAGLVTAYFVAFSYWAINFSRIGFRAVMVPMLLVWSFYFMFKGLRTKRYIDFTLSGLVFGLGVHTYIAFRVAPLVLVVLFCLLLIGRKHFLRDYWKQTVVFTIAMIITSLPMLLDFFVFHPEHYASRTGQISVLNPQTNQGNLPKALSKTTLLALGKYNFWGDQNWRHNYPPYPLLNPLTGVAFLTGFLLIIWRFLKYAWLRFARNLHDDRLHVYGFLLAWFFALLIPEVLAYEGNPHSLRAIGTLPVVFLIATTPAMWALSKAREFHNGFKIAIISLFAAGFIFIAIFDSVKYFVYFANNPKQHESFEGNLVTTSKYLQTLPAQTKKYVVTGSMQRVTIKYLNPDMPNLTYVYPHEIQSINPDSKDFVIIFTGKIWTEINATRDRFPGIKFEEHTNKFGDTFFVLTYRN